MIFAWSLRRLDDEIVDCSSPLTSSCLLTERPESSCDVDAGEHDARLPLRRRRRYRLASWDESHAKPCVEPKTT
jgi:hypothetical protein